MCVELLLLITHVLMILLLLTHSTETATHGWASLISSLIWLEEIHVVVCIAVVLHQIIVIIELMTHHIVSSIISPLITLLIHLWL